MEVSGKRCAIIEEEVAEKQEKLCEVCEVDHVTTKAYGLCRECVQLMCDTCFRHHLKVKSCRQHVLIDTKQSLSIVQGSAENVEGCNHHADEKITYVYYCRKHQVLGCNDCMVAGPRVCQPENINYLSKGFQQNEHFKSLMRQFEIIMSANKEHDENVQESKTSNEDMFEKAMKEIKIFRAEINNYMDRAEASVIKQAKDIARENNQLLTDLERECTLISSRISNMRKLFDTNRDHDTSQFIQSVDWKTFINDIEMQVARIQKESIIRKFEFNPDKQLQDIITSAERLGSLGKRESQSPTKPITKGLPKVVSREEITCGLKQTEPVQGQKEKAQEPAKRVVAGARVRPIGECLDFHNAYHQGQPGTVTSVYKNGTVKVRWDATSETRHYIIGFDGHVKLI